MLLKINWQLVSISLLPVATGFFAYKCGFNIITSGRLHITWCHLHHVILCHPMSIKHSNYVNYIVIGQKKDHGQFDRLANFNEIGHNSCTWPRWPRKQSYIQVREGSKNIFINIQYIIQYIQYIYELLLIMQHMVYTLWMPRPITQPSHKRFWAPTCYSTHQLAEQS